MFTIKTIFASVIQTGQTKNSNLPFMNKKQAWCTKKIKLEIVSKLNPNFMPYNEETYEHIDAEIKKLDLKDFEAGGKNHFTAAAVVANPTSVLQSICSIYRRIKGILHAISNFPLLPVSWRAALKTYISLMNNLCP